MSSWSSFSTRSHSPLFLEVANEEGRFRSPTPEPYMDTVARLGWGDTFEQPIWALGDPRAQTLPEWGSPLLGSGWASPPAPQTPSDPGRTFTPEPWQDQIARNRSWGNGTVTDAPWLFFGSDQ